MIENNTFSSHFTLPSWWWWCLPQLLCQIVIPSSSPTVFSDENKLRLLIFSNLGEPSWTLSLGSTTTSPERMGGTTLFKKSIIRVFYITSPRSTQKRRLHQFPRWGDKVHYVCQRADTSFEFRWCRTPAG